MKFGKIFALFSALAMLVGMMGVVPVTAAATAVPFLKVGPRLDASQRSGGGGMPIWSCQVGAGTGGYKCYDPYEMRHAYGVDTLISSGKDGTGYTIVIVDSFQSPYLNDDLDQFDSDYGLPARASWFTQVAPYGTQTWDSSNGDMVGWSEEITLDVEWAHAIAPGAHIVLDLAYSDADLDILAATQYAVTNRLGDVISQSFGENETCVDSSVMTAEHAMYKTAAGKNMTVFASSGDEGAAQMTCDGSSWTKVVSSPASDPLVTAVGGTSLTAATYCKTLSNCKPAPGTYKSEAAWDEKSKGGDGASGGGISVLYSQPGFQNGVVKGTMRGVPDVSYDAAVRTGVLVYYDYAYYGGPWVFGGTSAGSPQWAAIAAIADQVAGQPLGFLTGALYYYYYNPKSKDKTYSTIFHDVKSGGNSVTEFNYLDKAVKVKGYTAVAGWDAVTGQGSPNVPFLIPVLVSLGQNYNEPSVEPILNASIGSGGVVQPH